MGEIDLRIASLDDPPPDPTEDPADFVPDLAKAAPVSGFGDLWQLGPHRLFCGNALGEPPRNNPIRKSCLPLIPPGPAHREVAELGGLVRGVPALHDALEAL